MFSAHRILPKTCDLGSLCHQHLNKKYSKNGIRQTLQKRYPKFSKQTQTQRPKRIPKVAQNLTKIYSGAGWAPPALFVPSQDKVPPKIMNNQLKMHQKCVKGEPNPRILGPGSWILDPGSKILDPKS